MHLFCYSYCFIKEKVQKYDIDAKLPTFKLIAVPPKLGKQLQTSKAPPTILGSCLA